jgi:hypothetical protein
MRGYSDPPMVGIERLAPKPRQGGKSANINKGAWDGMRDILSSDILAFFP